MGIQPNPASAKGAAPVKGKASDEKLKKQTKKEDIKFAVKVAIASLTAAAAFNLAYAVATGKIVSRETVENAAATLRGKVTPSVEMQSSVSNFFTTAWQTIVGAFRGLAGYTPEPPFTHEGMTAEEYIRLSNFSGLDRFLRGLGDLVKDARAVPKEEAFTMGFFDALAKKECYPIPGIGELVKGLIPNAVTYGMIHQDAPANSGTAANAAATVAHLATATLKLVREANDSTADALETSTPIDPQRPGA